MSKRVLIIPDAVLGDASGAIVTQVVRDSLYTMGHTVGVFSSDIESDFENDTVSYFKDFSYSGWTNFKPKRYLERCRQVYDMFHPDVVLTLGSITNKPVCYVEEALRRRYIVSIFIFMQDFFCSKIYANDANGPCTKCLDKCLMYAYKNTCGVRSTLGWLRLTQRILTRRLWKRVLRKVNHVATTTKEQMSFYKRFGIPEDKHCTLYLPFASNKLGGLQAERGDYFIGIAQDRVEKGFQFIPQILQYTKCKVILAYSNEEKVRAVSIKTDIQPYLETGQLELVASSWRNNLGELVAKSCGVIIPSIWPTTTEYGWLEAMALSKPVCCFDISAHHEFIETGVNSFLAPIGDYRLFAVNMTNLSLLEQTDYNAVSNNSHLLFENLSNPNTVKNQLSLLLEP